MAAKDQAGLGPPLDAVAWVAGVMRSSLGNTVTLRSSRAASGCIEQCPSNCAPSWILRRGAAILPATFAEGRISIFCEPVMSPLTLPPTIIVAALICAVTTAVSPIWRLSFEVISPSTSPSIRAGPSNDTLPLTFVPRSRWARPSVVKAGSGRGAEDGWAAGAETAGWG